jgi:hypothetical protein
MSLKPFQFDAFALFFRLYLFEICLPFLPFLFLCIASFSSFHFASGEFCLLEKLKLHCSSRATPYGLIYFLFFLKKFSDFLSPVYIYIYDTRSIYFISSNPDEPEM